MDEKISDFKAGLYQWELRFEKRPALQIAAIIIYGLVTAVITFIDFFTALSIAPKVVLTLIILIMVLLLFLIDWLHVSMIRQQRNDLDRRKNFIREIISTQPLIYRVNRMREFYDVEEDGDCNYLKEMTLHYDGEDITWAEIWLGSTNQYGTDFSQMILHAKSFPNNQTLSRIPLQEEGSRLRYAILLKNKITNNHQTEGYQVLLKWLGVWKALMTDLNDNGDIRIEHVIDEYILEILLPSGYSFKYFSMPRTSGIEEVTDKNGRALLTYKINNLDKIGERYDYFIEINKS